MVLLALAAASHWLLDLLVHRPDLPLWGNSFRVGLALWNHPVIAFLLELALLLACAAILVVAYAWTRQLALFWIIAALFLLACLFDQPRRADRPRGSGRRVGRFELILLVVTMLGAVLFTALVHRPDADDALYTSIPVALLDHPDRPMLEGDTMHGEEGLPLLGPFYRVVSYELLVGALANVPQ